MGISTLEVIYYVASSLDGYIATADGGVEWLAPFEGTEEDYGYTEFYESVDALLVGSRTYQQVVAFGEWPYPGKSCWVFTHRELEASRPEVTLTSQSPHELVSLLKGRGLRRVWLVGGAQIASSFREAGLITGYIISIMPVILGSGIRLFVPDGPKEDFELAECKSYSNGVVQLRYSTIHSQK